MKKSYRSRATLLDSVQNLATQVAALRKKNFTLARHRVENLITALRQAGLLFPKSDKRKPIDRIFSYEVCPHCDCEVEINKKYVTNEGTFICPICGTPAMLCSECTACMSGPDNAARVLCEGCDVNHSNFTQLPNIKTKKEKQ